MYSILRLIIKWTIQAANIEINSHYLTFPSPALRWIIRSDDNNVFTIISRFPFNTKTHPKEQLEILQDRFFPPEQLILLKGIIQELKLAV